MWGVGDVACSECGIFGMYDIRHVACSECGMFSKWDVRDMGCWGCGLFGMWVVWDVGCSGCGMFAMWDVCDVGCLGCGIWDVRCLLGCRMLIYKMPHESNIHIPADAGLLSFNTYLFFAFLESLRSTLFLSFSIVIPYTLLFINLKKSSLKLLFAFFLFKPQHSMNFCQLYF